MKSPIPLLLSAVTLLAAPLPAAPVISEFLAVNHGPDIDDFGGSSDWIEIYNPDLEPVNLAGWSLTDEPDNPGKWVFPAVSVGAGEYLVVRASGRDLRNPDNPLHTSFSLSGDGEFLALYSPAQVCTSCWQPYPLQFSGISYGTVHEGTSRGYFDTPTPGASNPFEALTDYVRDTRFSVDRGFFTAPFTVTLSCETPGATIRYTLDGSIPTENAGILYTGPVNIANTTVLRARAFRTGWVPSNTDTQTYIFAQSWRTQPDFPAGLSVSWGQFDANAKVRADYGMNAAIVNDAAYSSLIIPAMTQTLPVVCVTGPAEEIFGDNGLHGNLRQTDTEVPVGIEYFDPRSPGTQFAARGALNIHGGAVREFAKKGFRLDFTGAFGDGPLRYPLFPGSPVESFDQLVLRPGGHDSFTARTRGGNPDNNDIAFHASYLRDQFLRGTEIESGLLSPRGRYVHLCINGLYWGLYDLHERPNAEFSTAHEGGSAPDWDVIHHNNISSSDPPQVLDGNLTAWNDLQLLSSLPVNSDAAYLALAQLLGPDRYIDHLLIRMWGGDHDWLGPAYMPSSTQGTTGNVAVYSGKNWYALRNSRALMPGPWEFFTWDGEISMGNHLLFRFFDNLPTPAGLDFPHQRELNLDFTGISRAGTPAAPWAALVSHPEFRLKVADRAQRLFKGDGLLAPASAAARIQLMMDELDTAIVAESARWGGVSGYGFIFSGGTLYRIWDNALLKRDVHWRPEVAWLRDTFAAQRGEILINQLKARSLYPATAPAVISPPSGPASGVTSITLTAPAGDIYYTVDGSDPRTAFSGSPAPVATLYTGPFPGPANPAADTVVKVRALSGGEWSALTEVRYTAAQTVPEPGMLAITELHYHPVDPTPEEAAALGFSDADAFEFIEITNREPLPLRLERVRFAAGIDFDFAVNASVNVIPAHGSIVLAAHAAAFQLRYGSAPHGVFANGTRLSNSGEQIKVVRDDGTVLIDFTYNDRGDWPAAADGGGSSLHLLAPLEPTDPGKSSNWRAAAPMPGAVSATLSYAEWRGDFFTAAEVVDGLGDPNADPDGDSLENLVEYATKSNPRKHSSHPVSVSFPEPGKVRFAYERRSGMNVMDYGPTLELIPAPGVPYLPTAVVATGNATQRLEYDLPMPTGGRLFSRLKVGPVP